MEWNSLTTLEQLTRIQQDSGRRPVIIYKHSTRCGISSMALHRLERDWQSEEMQAADVYFLDILRYRDVSQAVSAAFGIRHESPQLLLISEGRCVYDASHMMISYPALKQQLSTIANPSA